MTDERPDPDQLLAKVKAEEAEACKGKLKIFFGMAPGVGKTYAMLEAARKVAKEGVDVVVGYVEPHARPETQALVLGLEILPKRSLEYRGRTIQEFDLEAALARKPQLLLVDELAHTNAEGLTHAKRWQDVADLLEAGINVYTTLNVQHLESVNDIVAHVTAAPVRETVPDHIFETADDIELVDISPDDLVERLLEGKVYVPEQARRAIENFFRKGNLIALRELALRKTAERVSTQAIDFRQEHQVEKIWHTSERLLVCVGTSPMSARLVRAARRMATSLRAPLTALHVELQNAPHPSPTNQQRLDENLRLAEELGANVEHAIGSDFATAVLEFARKHNVTKIIVGKPQRSRWQDLLRGAFVFDLIRRCGDIDVYVISGDEVAAANTSSIADRKPKSFRPYLWATVVISICTAVCLLLTSVLVPTNLAMIYLACVVGVALLFGRGPSILATVLGVAAFDFLFVPPYWTFAVSNSEYLVTFGVMLATGLVISELTARVQSQTVFARERERRTASLFALSKELATTATREATSQTARRIIGDALEADVCLIVSENGSLISADAHPPATIVEKDAGVIRWVFDHRRPAGAGTETLPGTSTLYLPLLVSGGMVGVLGVQPRNQTTSLTSQQRELLQAFSSQVAGALERCELAIQAEQIRLQAETERMRNALLSAVSHDLRTPLATISGAASVLIDQGDKLSSATRRELAESVLDEGERLHRLVTNLLDLTRLDAGAIELHRELQPIEEVIGVVLQRLDRQLREHKVITHLANDLPPVPIDALLIQQVFANLLDNAAKFAPHGSTIEITANRQNDFLVVEVADRGPGIPAGEETRLFEKFHRADGHARSGSGIGLTICRGVVLLHGGTIEAHNRHDGGALFRFSLPINMP